MPEPSKRPQKPNTNQMPSRHPENGNRITPDELYKKPNPYRSAAPYMVPPRENKQHVPYPSRALERKKRRKALRRRRILVFSVLGLILAALIFVIVCIIRMAIGALQDDPVRETESQAVNVPVLQETTGLLTETTVPPAVQTEPLPLYEAPNCVNGTLLCPKMDDTTLTIDAEISCPHMLLIDADSGIIAAQKNAEGQIFPASMTKLMTILVAYESCTDLTKTFRMTNEIIDPLYLDGMSLAGFVGGEDVTILDLLYGSALPSGAEASVALALASCGSEESFVEKMNLRAQSLGMEHTHFENCTGAHHDNHVSSLSDIAVLMDYVMQNETLYEICSSYQHTTAPTAQHPDGVLLTSTVFSRMEGTESGCCTVLGGKTGYTAQAMQCLVTYAARNDTARSYICVIAGGEDKWKVVFDTIAMYQQYTKP